MLMMLVINPAKKVFFIDQDCPRNYIIFVLEKSHLETRAACYFSLYKP